MAEPVEFDRIAPVYDETRRPPSEGEVEVLAGLLSGSVKILDAGVGTGRFAVPLRAHHFEVIGVDLSVAMMARARSKGVSDLVRADLRKLPFQTGSVDAAFMAHVLQLIPEPRLILAELGRVARNTVVVLLPDWAERGPEAEWHRHRERYRELAAELGYVLPPRGRRYRHSLDELSRIAPPKFVQEIPPAADPVPTTDDWGTHWQARLAAEGQVPPEIHEQIIRRLREEQPARPDRTRRHRTERFVGWDARELRATI